MKPCRTGRVWVALFLASVCGLATAAERKPDLPQQALSPFPIAVSQNAVAQLTIAGRSRFFSFGGEQRSVQKTTYLRDALAYDPDDGRWQSLPAIPGAARTQASAIGLDRYVFLIGGWVRGSDAAARVTPEVWRFDPLQLQYDPMPPLPVPVRDALALSFGGRFIAVIGGQDDSGPVAKLQIFDSVSETWLGVLDAPGKAWAGASGAMIADVALICGGAFLRAESTHLAVNDQCWQGRFSAKAPMQVQWQAMEAPASLWRYRAVAAADAQGGVVFASGSVRAYGADLLTQDGQSAPRSDEVWRRDRAGQWSLQGRLPVTPFETRALLARGGGFLSIGGVNTDDQSVKVVRQFHMPAPLLQN